MLLLVCCFSASCEFCSDFRPLQSNRLQGLGLVLFAKDFCSIAMLLGCSKKLVGNDAGNMEFQPLFIGRSSILTSVMVMGILQTVALFE